MNDQSSTASRNEKRSLVQLVKKLIAAFSPTERIIFLGLVALFGASTLTVLWSVNNYFSVEIPTYGGTLHEGVIGSPRFVNPLLAISDTDRDLTSLIYSGLLRSTPQGDFVPDLAESYSVSEDGLTYHFVLKDKIYFHDKMPVTADDVIFTIQKAADRALKSPKRANWEGVTAEKISEREIELHLKQPYAPFLQNATIGILPKHIWKNVDADSFPFSQFNIEPVGSGPYELNKIKRDSNGLPISYELRAFRRYALGQPFITTIAFHFYAGEKNLLDAYQSGIIESLSAISPERAALLDQSENTVRQIPLSRVFGIFFNQNQSSVLANKEVRAALEAAADKKKIVDEVLGGFGTTLSGPIPDFLKGFAAESATSSPNTETKDRIETAKSILEKAGWKLNEKTGLLEKKGKKSVDTLEFSLSTSDAPELRKAAELVKADWEKIGARIDLKVFESGDLNQNVIRPRKYDALLFGEIIGKDLDLFAFWHSSQRNDPGLNIALYTNIKTDTWLEEARAASDPAKRATLYQKFENEIKNDLPTIFLYSPDFLYILPNRVHMAKIEGITAPAERFSTIQSWYIETERVWKVFASTNK